MAFKKGESGNPGGRPKGVKEVQEAAREHTKLAVDTLASIASNPKQGGSARVTAAAVLLDRGWGRAPQTVAIEGLNTLPDHVINAILAVCDALDTGSIVPGGQETDSGSVAWPAGTKAH